MATYVMFGKYSLEGMRELAPSVGPALTLSKNGPNASMMPIL